MSSVSISEHDGVVTITLPDPRLQGLARSDLARLADTIETAQTAPSVGAILLRGVPGAFCEGLELTEFTEECGHSDLQDALRRCFHAFARNELPIVAAVEGRAFGLGMSILCHADAVIASATSEFGAPFVSLGLVPEAGSTLVLRERLGYLQAVRFFCLGETVSAAEALALGLVSEVVSGNEVQARALERAHLFARRTSEALRVTRRLLRDDVDRLVDRIDAELDASRTQLDKAATVKRLARIASMARRTSERRPVAPGRWKPIDVLAS